MRMIHNAIRGMFALVLAAGVLGAVPADKVLIDAKAKASAENKAIFLVFGAPG